MSICTSLDLYFEMGLPMLENQVNESQSHAASHRSLKRGMGCYNKCPFGWNINLFHLNRRFLDSIKLFLFISKIG